MSIPSFSEFWDEDSYYEARNDAFREFIEEEVDAYLDTDREVSVDGFYDEIGDMFEFPDIDEWMTDAYQSRMDDYYDAKYEQMKDERMGL